MSTATVQQRIFNFSPGPAVLPLPVLEQVQRDLVSLPGYGMSLLEMSHRAPGFLDILAHTQRDLRELLAIPEGYEVLFLQGGSRLQFSMVPMNLGRGAQVPAEYLVTGTWSKMAYAEAPKEGPAKVVWDGKSTNYDRLPSAAEIQFHPQAPFVYLCTNETIQGVQFATDWDTGGPPLVADMSSDFLHRAVNVGRYGLIYACAQKNAGPAGVTVVIIRKDLLDRSAENLPGYLSYKNHAAENSLYNTPPTFAIYVMGLVLKWLKEDRGGLAAMHAHNRAKAKTLYDAIDSSGGFYRGHAQPDCRSLMNVTFRLPSEELEKKFAKEAEQRGLDGLKGHRSVGGMRASIYNAMPQAGVDLLAQFMREFQRSA
jgi:phosphoserine aminotransferase